MARSTNFKGAVYKAMSLFDRQIQGPSFSKLTTVRRYETGCSIRYWKRTTKYQSRLHVHTRFSKQNALQRAIWSLPSCYLYKVGGLRILQEHELCCCPKQHKARIMSFSKSNPRCDHDSAVSFLPLEEPKWNLFRCMCQRIPSAKRQTRLLHGLFLPPSPP